YFPARHPGRADRGHGRSAGLVGQELLAAPDGGAGGRHARARRRVRSRRERSLGALGGGLHGRTARPGRWQRLTLGRAPGTWILVGALVIAHFVLHVGLGFGRGAPDLLTIALL